MKTDLELQKAVFHKINQTSILHYSDIDVEVNNGKLTLNGIVCCHLKKMETIKAVQSVAGITEIEYNLVETIYKPDKYTDCEILLAIENAFIANLLDPHEYIIVRDSNDALDLEGVADWQFQNNAACNYTDGIEGLKKLKTNTTLISSIHADKIKTYIQRALQSNLSTENAAVTFEIMQNQIILKGMLNSINEKEEVEKKVWSIPGILNVINEIKIAN